MRHARVLAIDCGAAHVACGLFKTGGATLELEQFACERFVIPPVGDASWVDVAGQALATLMAREKFPVRECILSVPGHMVLTKFVKTPAVKREQRAGVVRFEAAQNIPYPLDEVSWGHVEVGDDGAELTIMLAAAKLDGIEALCAVVAAAGLNVTRIEPGSVALWRSWRRIHGAAASPALLVDIGARATHLIFAVSEGLFIRTLPFGGNALTQALGESLQLEFAAAEALKLQLPGAADGGKTDALTQEAVARAVGQFAGRLQLEITRSRLGYARQAGLAAPTQIFLTGGSARLPGLRETLAAGLELAVKPLDLPSHRIFAAGANAAEAETAAEYLAMLPGLATPTVGPRDMRLDLLPPSRRLTQTWQRQQAWWLAGAALLVAALLPPLLYYHARTGRLKAQAAAMSRELTPLHRLAAANADELEHLQKLRAQIDAIGGIATGRANWIAFMADLQQRLGQVGDVWLERLQVVRDPAAAKPGPEAKPPLRLALAGRLLDTENPLSKASADSYARVKTLLGSLGVSPFVRAVENERFDNNQPGVLRFEFTLVLNPDHPL